MYIRLRYFILVALVLAAHWLMTDATEAQAQAQNREPQTLTEIVSEVDAKWASRASTTRAATRKSPTFPFANL